ncbi:DUF3368 domain-containing protein [Lewinella sp. LCG006]|uniref:DUF3368 domain-containing protein n=1 Tax=Lewinella sp. LCG006 TaxID=3231911 RepID=UPI003460233A
MKIKLLLIMKGLYREILIPNEVYKELAALSKQKKVIDSFDWIKIVEIKNRNLYEELREKLDKGESEAIVLALELNSDFLVMDEAKGRRIARSYGIRIIGLLGILVLAKEEGLIPKVEPYMKDLKEKMGFRISEKLYKDILIRVNEG